MAFAVDNDSARRERGHFEQSRRIKLCVSEYPIFLSIILDFVAKRGGARTFEDEGVQGFGLGWDCLFGFRNPASPARKRNAKDMSLCGYHPTICINLGT
jgi:hypothetical protein